MGRQPVEGDIIFGIVFLTVCNIALYGTLIYISLSALHLLRHRRAEPGAPPPPHLSIQN
jgi:hypothetical protein